MDDANTVSFELNNALSLDKVTDEQGRQIQASRIQQDMSVRLSLPQPLPSGKLATLTFNYDGKLTGDEESPVFGIKFAAIHPDFAYLLYPARWFPVNDYTTDRFSSDLKVTVPMGYHVLASGIDSNEPAPDGMTTTRFQFKEASFPGSLAVVRATEPRSVSAAGVKTTFYFRDGAAMAGAYGEEFSRAMTFFTDLYGLPPKRNLTVVETEAGAPNGYSAPGLIFLRPRRYRQDREYEAGGQQCRPAMVGRGGVAHHAQSSVDRKWHGALLRAALRGACERARRLGAGSTRHLHHGADGGSAAADPIRASGGLFA